jgi:diguanylate cyclase (GGDEF)-like protein
MSDQAVPRSALEISGAPRATLLLEDPAILSILAERLATTTGAQFALIIERIADDPNVGVARVVATSPADAPAPTEFSLLGTIWESMGSGDTTFPFAVGRVFPDDPILRALHASSFVGTALLDERRTARAWIAVVDSRPIGDLDLARQCVTDVANWARRELRRIAAAQPTRVVKHATPPRSLMVTDEDSSAKRRRGDVQRDARFEWHFGSQSIQVCEGWREVAATDSPAPDALKAWMHYVHPDDRCGMLRAIAACSGSEDGRLNVRYRLLLGDGNYKWVAARALILRDALGVPSRLVGWLSPATERPSEVGPALQLPARDPLTRLATGALVLDRLNQVVQRPGPAAGDHFALLVVDLDQFQRVNSLYGDVSGDRMLRAIAARLRASVRDEDTVVRLGSDRFAILLESLQESCDAVRVAERVLRSLAEPMLLGDTEVFVTACVGVALSDFEYERAGTMMRDADTALQAAKRVGSGTYAIFESAMHDAIIAQLQLEIDLRHAVEMQEFELVYQPIVSCTTTPARFYEALLRWQHPVRGQLPPSAFLAVLQSTGSLWPVGAWVIRSACRQLREWRDAGNNTRVSVNLCPQQLLDPALKETIGAALAEFRLPGSALVLEITEDAFIEDATGVVQIITDLRERGIDFYIDDFGTGYSSLSYLRQLPVQGVKIDRTFLVGADEPGVERDVLGGIIQLSHALGLHVVAEGVETEAQLDTVRALGCDYAQGFLIAHPLRAEDVL